MILVTGATGQIGSEALRRLVERGARLRVLVRDRARAGWIEELGVEVAEGDLADADGLRGALEGVERMLLVSSLDPRQGDLQAGAVEAAREAGVRQVVKVSGTAVGLGPAAPSPLGRAHWRVEQELERSGLEFTLLRPNFFMQNLLGSMAPLVARAGLLAAPMGDAPVAMVDVRDVAAVAAVALTEDGHAGRVYDVTGPRSLTFAEVADVLSSAAGKRVAYVDVPPAMARQELGKDLPEWEVEHLLATAELFRLGGGSAVSPAVPEVTGGEARDLSDFAGEHADVFRGNGLPAPARVAVRSAARARARAAGRGARRKRAG